MTGKFYLAALFITLYVSKSFAVQSLVRVKAGNEPVSMDEPEVLKVAALHNNVTFELKPLPDSSFHLRIHSSWH